MLNTMICRLYGEEKSTHFQMEWIPMAYTVVKTGTNFQLGRNTNLQYLPEPQECPRYEKTQVFTCLHTSLMLYALLYNFLPLDGVGTNINHLVHVYCSELWDINYKKYIYDICDCFLAPLHTIIFGYPTYRISREAMAGMKDIADWYLGKYYTYIRVYGNSKAPHLLPKYVPDRLLIWEISYQTMGTGITSLLSGSSKNIWPTFLSI
jgi:hypothetical protein